MIATAKAGALMKAAFVVWMDLFALASALELKRYGLPD
jgi:hypothetical protein